MVECGGLENRLARNPGHGGSNPPSSARLHAAGTGNRACFVFCKPVLTLRAARAAKLTFNRRSRTKVRFAPLSSHLRSPARHSLSLVRMDHRNATPPATWSMFVAFNRFERVWA